MRAHKTENCKKCARCENKLSEIQKKAIQEYKNECYKLYIEPNKFFKPLLHKEYLFFDLANYMNLPTEHIGKIKLILSKYSYWESVTITSTIKFASLSKISSTLNSILLCLSDNLTKFKGVHSLNLINLQVKNSKTLSLLHSIIVNNHSLLSLSFNSCDFSFEKIGNNLKTSKSEKIIRNSKQLITIPKKTQLVHSLFQSLINHENIQNLSLMGNAITDDFSPSIVEIVRNQNNNKKASNWKYTLHKPFNLSDIPLKYNLNSLCYLDLSHNYLSKKFTQEFIPVLENDIFLRKLDLSYNDIEYEDCEKFSKALKTNKTLINLNLNYNPGYLEKVHIKIIFRLGSNIKYLKECYEKGEYNENQFRELISKYAELEMFTIGNEEEIRTNNHITNENIEEIDSKNITGEFGKKDNEYEEDNNQTMNYKRAMNKIKLLEEENARLKNQVLRKNNRSKSASTNVSYINNYEN